MSALLIIGIILFVVGVLLALAWKRDLGLIMAVLGAVIALVVILVGDGATV